MSTAALIVAGGSGTRMGAQIPKQYLDIGGKPVIRHTIEAFLHHPRIALVQAVIASDHAQFFSEAVMGLKMPMPVLGGATRQQSVLNGLEALARREMGAPSVVMIHDAARPFVTPALIESLLDNLGMHEGVIPALPITDTIKRVNEENIIVQTVPRDTLRAAQTPQTFYLSPILAAHRQARDEGKNDLTDDAAVAENAGYDVAVIPGDPDNRKITTPHDLRWAEEKLKG